MAIKIAKYANKPDCFIDNIKKTVLNEAHMADITNLFLIKKEVFKAPNAQSKSLETKITIKSI